MDDSRRSQQRSVDESASSDDSVQHASPTDPFNLDQSLLAALSIGARQSAVTSHTKLFQTPTMLKTPISKLPVLTDPNREELRRRLVVVTEIIESADLTPYSKRLHDHYRNSIEAALGNREAPNVLDQFRHAQKEILHHDPYRLMAGDEQKKLASEILKLKKFQMYNMTGDYMKYELEPLAQANGSKDFWSQILPELQREEKAAAKDMTYKIDMELKLLAMEWHSRLWDACKNLKVDTTDIRKTLDWYKLWITKYTHRNELAHTGYESLAKEQNWGELGVHITRDLDMLPSLFNMDEEEEMQKYVRLLTTVRDRWVEPTKSSWQARAPVARIIKLGVDDYDLIKEATMISDDLDPVDMEAVVQKIKARHDQKRGQKAADTAAEEKNRQRKADIAAKQKQQWAAMQQSCEDWRARALAAEAQLELVRRIMRDNELWRSAAMPWPPMFGRMSKSEEIVLRCLQMCAAVSCSWFESSGLAWKYL